MPPVRLGVWAFGRLGLQGLQAANALSDKSNALVCGAAKAAFADVIEKLSFAELELIARDATPFVQTHVSHHMQMVLSSLPCIDALKLCQSSQARGILVRHICRNALAAQSAAVLLVLLADPMAEPTGSALEALPWTQSHVRDTETLEGLWRLHAFPGLSARGRIALLRVLLQSESPPTLQTYVGSLDFHAQISFMQDMQAANCTAPKTVRAILNHLADDTLLAVQVCARSYLREMDDEIF